MAQWSSHHRRSTDSKSLWNFTLSPGWVDDEIRVLRLAIMKLGVGRWQEVLPHLPGKTVSQLNLQAQRMFGQQSLGEFAELHVDPARVYEHNAKLQGDGVIRKNGCIVNTGDNMTPEERRERRELNQARYGLSQAEVDAIEIPALDKGAAPGAGEEPLSRSAKLVLLELLLERQREVEDRLAQLEEDGEEDDDGDSNNDDDDNRQPAKRARAGPP